MIRLMMDEATIDDRGSAIDDQGWTGKGRGAKVYGRSMKDSDERSGTWIVDIERIDVE
jgi:hypothetical protein